MTDEPAVKVDLKWCDTEDLLDELQKRHSACVFSGLREKEHEGGAFERRVWYRGDGPTVLGMLRLAMAHLERFLLEGDDDECEEEAS
jgi:hypothetical protein